MQQLLLDIQPPARPDFDNFVVGQNAEVLHSLKNALLVQTAPHFIFVWGEAGSGKSHVLQACQAIADTLPQLELICVDDVHTLDFEAQIALFNTYNRMRDVNAMNVEKYACLIVTGNAAPTQMRLREDLATRLAWGLTYQLKSLTDEEKALALLKHADSRGMRLPTDVIEYCLRYLRRDLPTLIATINALDAWSLTTKKPVTVPMLRQLLQLPLNV
jgi:DnaA-homolog protein